LCLAAWKATLFRIELATGVGKLLPTPKVYLLLALRYLLEIDYTLLLTAR